MSQNVLRLRYVIVLSSFVAALFFQCQRPEDVFDNGDGSDTLAPTVPGGLSASEITDSSVVVSWQPSGDNVAVKNYVLYQDKVQILTDSLTRYTVTGLSPQTIYTYSVRAVDGAGNISRFSPQITATTLKKIIKKDSIQLDTIAPTAPKNLLASNTTGTSTELSWNTSTDSSGVLAYRVYQDTILLASVPDTTYLVANLSPGLNYNFSVSAIDISENESVLSNVVSVTTVQDTVRDTIAPPPPTNLIVTDSSQTTIGLSWEAVADSVGAIEYRVYQDTTIVTTITETRYEATELLPETEYSFSVSAIDSLENESALSNIVVVTTEAEEIVLQDTVPPTTPTNLIAEEVSQTTVNLRWDAATDSLGVANYTVYQDGGAIVTVAGTTYRVTGLAAGTSYNFTVSAADTAENVSQQSEVLTVTTQEEEQSLGDKVLVFTKTLQFRHASIEKGVNTLIALGDANNFEVFRTENASDFNAGNLVQYRTVVFLNTTGDVLDPAQQTAFENYIRAGGSYMGIHAASDTEYDWPWYGELVGAYFNGHPDVQEATVNTIDNNHPSTSHLPSNWVRTDEWYNFRDINPNIIPLLNLDESTYIGGTNGTVHPIAWYHEFDGGKSFYTGGGHGDAAYDEPDFRQHLLGGILYCLGR